MIFFCTTYCTFEGRCDASAVRLRAIARTLLKCHNYKVFSLCVRTRPPINVNINGSLCHVRTTNKLMLAPSARYKLIFCFECLAASPFRFHPLANVQLFESEFRRKIHRDPSANDPALYLSSDNLSLYVAWSTNFHLSAPFIGCVSVASASMRARAHTFVLSTSLLIAAWAQVYPSNDINLLTRVFSLNGVWSWSCIARSYLWHDSGSVQCALCNGRQRRQKSSAWNVPIHSGQRSVHIIQECSDMWMCAEQQIHFWFHIRDHYNWSRVGKLNDGDERRNRRRRNSLCTERRIE